MQTDPFAFLAMQNAPRLLVFPWWKRGNVEINRVKFTALVFDVTVRGSARFGEVVHALSLLDAHFGFFLIRFFLFERSEAAVWADAPGVASFVHWCSSRPDTPFKPAVSFGYCDGIGSGSGMAEVVRAVRPREVIVLTRTMLRRYALAQLVAAAPDAFFPNMSDVCVRADWEVVQQFNFPGALDLSGTGVDDFIFTHVLRMCSVTSPRGYMESLDLRGCDSLSRAFFFALEGALENPAYRLLVLHIPAEMARHVSFENSAHFVCVRPGSRFERSAGIARARCRWEDARSASASSSPHDFSSSHSFPFPAAASRHFPWLRGSPAKSSRATALLSEAVEKRLDEAEFNADDSDYSDDCGSRRTEGSDVSSHSQ